MAMTVVYRNTSALDLAGLWSPANYVYCKLTGDTSYPQGAGYAVTPGTFGLTQQILAVIPVAAPGSIPSLGNYVWYDPANKSIRWIVGGNTTLSEVATATNISATSLDVVVVGY